MGVNRAADVKGRGGFGQSAVGLVGLVGLEKIGASVGLLLWEGRKPRWMWVERHRG